MRSILVYILIIILIVLFFGVLFFPRTLYNVKAGHTAVLFRPLAAGVDTTFYPDEGWFLTWPWNEVTDYDVRLQRFTQHYSILTNYGLKLELDLNIIIKLNYNIAPFIHRAIGEDYYEKYIIPRTEGASRLVLSRYREDEIYTKSLTEISDEIEEEIMGEFRKYFDIVTVDVLEIGLPQGVQEAINEKLKEEQLEQAYEFKLERERKEAIRMKIMSEGIRYLKERAFEGNIESYLHYRGIEATKELAESNNSKIIVIGNDKSGGLPLIVNTAPGSPNNATADPEALDNFERVLDSLINNSKVTDSIQSK